MKTTLLFLSLFLFSASQNLSAQEVYTSFTNSSFEDIARPQHVPFGWRDCAPPSETPPDIHPVISNGSLTKINGVITRMNGAFGVTTPAQDESTYLGMVVREDGTWESVGQRLNQSLEPNDCYLFNIFLSTSKTYISSMKGRSEDISFTDPIRLRVWGGNGYCEKSELLIEGELIDHHDWKEYSFRFSPTKKVSFLILEAYYDDDANSMSNGNLLLDNLSSIFSIDCEDLKKSTVERPEKSSIITLENSIIWYGKSVKFDDTDDTLTPLSIENLTAIIKDVKTLKKQKLIFVVKSKSRHLEQIKALNLFLKEQDLPNKQYTVRKFEPSDENEIWFSENNFLSIGLQKME